MEKLLAQGADPSRGDPTSRPTDASPIFLAASYASLRTIGLLLESWPTGRPMPRVTAKSMTPLLKLTLLLTRSKDAKSPYCILGGALEGVLVQAAGMLLGADPECVDVPDVKGWTPLQTTAGVSSDECDRTSP